MSAPIENLNFVGRDKELNNISRIINEPQKTNEIILISGKKGGEGKTRLLQETHRIFSEKTKQTTTGIIDISDTTFKTDFALTDKIINELDVHHFTNYTRLKTDYLRAVNAKLSEETIAKTYNEVQDAFIKDFNYEFDSHDLTNERKQYIILIDVYDKQFEANKSIKVFFDKIITRLENCTIIVAGRNTHTLQKRITQKPENSYSTTTIELKNLDREAAGKLLSNIRNRELKEKVNAICNGSPLMLGLSNIFFNLTKKQKPDVLNKPISELQAEHQEYQRNREKYEEEIFGMFIDGTFEEYEDYILQMAFFEKRYNIEIMCHVNSITEKRAKQILDDLKLGFFIKRRAGEIHLLHDIIREKIKHKIIPLIDRHQPSDRITYTEKIIPYYNEKITQCKDRITKFKEEKPVDIELKIYEWEQKILTYSYEKYFYALQYKPEPIITELRDDIKKALHDNRYDKIDLLKPLIDNWIKNAAKLTDKDFKSEFFKTKYEYARFLRIRSHFDDAGTYLNELINDDNDEILRAEYRHTLAFVYRDRGLLDKALDILKKSAKDIKGSDKEAERLRIYNSFNLGQVYADLGILNKATQKYNETIRGARKNKYDEIQAGAYLMLGLANMFAGKLAHARNNLKRAEEIYNKIEDTFGKLHAIMSQARIETRYGRFEIATQLFDTAEKAFRDANNKTWLAAVLNYRSRADFENFIVLTYGFQKGNFVDDEVFLLEAQKIATESDTLCREYRPVDLAESLMNTANIELELAKMYQAEYEKNEVGEHKTIADKYFSSTRQKLQEALLLSIKSNNLRIYANAIEIMAEYFFERKQNKVLHQMQHALNSLSFAISMFENYSVENLKKIDNQWFADISSFNTLISGIPVVKTDDTIVLKLRDLEIKDTIYEDFNGEISFLKAQNYRERGDIDNSLHHYKIAIAQLAKPGEWPQLVFNERIKEVRDYLYSIEDEDIQRFWIKELKNEWEPLIKSPQENIGEEERIAIEETLFELETA